MKTDDYLPRQVEDQTHGDNLREHAAGVFISH
eukprot:COSAG06_NODE_56061_length_286_cov_1.379679_1_plen_31_part_10